MKVAEKCYDIDYLELRMIGQIFGSVFHRFRRNVFSIFSRHSAGFSIKFLKPQINSKILINDVNDINFLSFT